ncbi:hypothetical protein [Neotabrizicola sp. sgz301269]|uniref:hypothetical protein n=1 Tax=Neotabrizicola sp. sgz301269 TaxID=3276282 RepID=UPI00376F47B7
MAKWTMVPEVPEDVLHRAHNPDKGGRPEGAKDKRATGKRNRPRQTHKAAVVAKAADWHIATAETNVSITVERFFEEYSQGMTEDGRYFRSRLIAEISKRSQ